MKSVLVTGGYGFIASNFIHKLLLTEKYNVVCLDILNMCADEKNIRMSYNYNTNEAVETPGLSRFTGVIGDIADRYLVMKLLETHNIQIVYHFAAQTHVDNSFGNPTEFVVENVLGTSILLETCRKYGKLEKFIHVSTDEVYGSVSKERENLVLEYGIYNPSNPYAATKAAAELMALSYACSYSLPVIITRSNNVYGPRQYWEKIIPRFLYLLKHGQQVPVYGDGSAKRKYLYVDDAADAYLTIMEHGSVGKIYEMGSDNEFSAIEVAKLLTAGDISRIKFVEDRPFHDQRYIANNKALEELGWYPRCSFEEGIRRTICWYNDYAIPANYWDH